MDFEHEGEDCHAVPPRFRSRPFPLAKFWRLAQRRAILAWNATGASPIVRPKFPVHRASHLGSSDVRNGMPLAGGNTATTSGAGIASRRTHQPDCRARKHGGIAGMDAAGRRWWCGRD